MMDPESCYEERTCGTLVTEKDETSRVSQVRPSFGDVAALTPAMQVSQVRPSFGDVAALTPAMQNRIEQYPIVTSCQGVTQAVRTSLSPPVMEYYNRMYDRHNALSTTCKPCSLPSNATFNMLTKGSQPENAIGNGNNSTQGVRRFGTDVEVTGHSQGTYRNHNEEHFRNVTGQETKTTYVSYASKTAIPESAPRERKRWVRPPLVGQSSTYDNSTAVQDISLPAVNNKRKENYSVQEELPQTTYAEKETDYSEATKETRVCKELCSFNSPTEDNDFKLYSCLQGKEYRTETCRVLYEKSEDFFCGKAEEEQKHLLSGKVFVVVPSPTSNQYQTYMSSSQNQDSSAVATEAVGSGRAPSPSSVSSVTSSRRLEWDSGADVGYHNYRPENGESRPDDGLSTIERIALARGCSAALRLEPEGTAGSVQQLNAVQFKPTAKSSKHVWKVPLAVSTPVELEQRVAGSATGTDSECEITPLVKIQPERCIFNGEEHSCCLAERKSTSTVQQKVQSLQSKGQEGCNVLSKKVSNSLSDLHEHRHHEVSENSLRRSHSHLSLLSKEDYKTKAFHDSNSSSYPLQHQHKRNKGLATCSLSSSSISTVIPNHECPGMPDKLIQTPAFLVPSRNSIGIQVSDMERDCKSVCATSYFTPEHDDNALKCVATLNPEKEILLEGADSDIIDRTDSNAAVDTISAKRSPRRVSTVKQNYIHAAQVQPQKQSYQEIKHCKLQGNRKIENQSCALCKGIHRRGSSKCQWHLVADGTAQNVIDTSEEKPSTCIHKPSLQTRTNQSEEDATENNSGTLDSVTSSTQTAGSWCRGETPQLANENQNLSGRRGSSGIVGSANSFEYLPGHVYENSSLVVDKYLCRNTAVGRLFSESASSQPLAGSAENKFEASNDKSWGSSVSSTFARDIEKSVYALKDLLNSKSYNSDKKKNLMQRVINRLIETSRAEDKALPEFSIPRMSLLPAEGHTVQGASQEDTSDGCKMRRTMERGKVSGDSGSEQQSGSNPRPATPASMHQAFSITDRGVQSVLSAASGLSSVSESHTDSRAETTTNTTQGCAGSLSADSTFPRNWKELSTQSEEEHEQCKHKTGRHIQSVLLSLCETERETQLSWICTEIRHLNNLKQLLEKEKRLKSKPLDLEVQAHRGSQRRRRGPVTSQSTEPESARSNSAYSSSAGEARVKEIEIGHSKSVGTHPCKHINTSSPRGAEKQSGLGNKFASQLHQSSSNSDSDLRTVVSNRRDIFTKFPTAVELGNRSAMRGKGVQIPALSNADTYELIGGVVSDSTAPGRINVLKQTRAKKSLTEEEAQRSELISKNIANASKSNEFSRAAVKQPELNESTPLCCCECKKLLREIRSGIGSAKQKSSISSVGGHVKIDSLLDKQKNLSSSGRKKQSKNMDNNFVRSYTFSSSAAAGNAVELTHDLDHVKTSVAAETAGSTRAQTMQAPSLVPSVRPQWHSPVPQESEKLSSKAENVIDSNCKKCPCCGTSEDEPDSVLVPSDNTDGAWKCHMCFKEGQDGRHIWKCQICGILQSALLTSYQSAVPDRDMVWKCSDCLTKLSDEERPVFSKCFQCGLQKGCENVREEEGNAGTTSSSSTPIKASVGYVITIESSTDSVSSVAEKSEVKPLEEITIKIPENKNCSVSSERKEKGKLRTGALKLSMNSSKEKRRLKGSTENRPPTEGAVKRNQLYSREQTLQEYLTTNRPDFVRSAENRRQCLEELSYLRELRQKSKQRLLALASNTSRFRGDSTELVNMGPLPPPPLAMKRIFSQRTMRSQTERKYRSLPEELGKKAEKKRKEDYRTNRLMAEIFARKLQKRVLQGDVNLSNSKSVISIT